MSAEISRAIEALSKPGDVIELRALKNGTTAAGYFDNPEALCKEAAKLDGQGFTVYVTANPIVPALLARAENKVKRPLRETTSDKDVLRRRWLLMDLDPERPAGVSSTDEEKQAALQRAREVYGYFGFDGAWYRLVSNIERPVEVHKEALYVHPPVTLSTGKLPNDSQRSVIRGKRTP